MSLNVGVNITEGESFSSISGVATNISCIMGNFQKGPVNEETLVGSMAAFERVFGTGPATGTTGYYSVEEFYNDVKGAAPLHVVRIASSAKAKSSLTIQDRQGTPADTLKIEALSEGVWGDSLQVVIADDNILSTIPLATISPGATSATLVSIGGLEVGSWIELDNGTQQEQKQVTGINITGKEITWVGGLTNTFTPANATVKSLEFKIEAYYANNLAKTWPGLSMVDAVSFHVEKVINNDSNVYISVTDMKSADAGLTDRPAVTAKTALASGADGLSDVTGSDYEGSASLKTGVYAFDSVPGLFRINCPNPKLTDVDADVAYKSLVQALLNYGNTRAASVYAGVPYNKTPAEAIAWAASFEGRNLSFWAHWIKVYTSTGNVYIPGCSAAMGAAVRKDADIGIHASVGNKRLACFDLERHLSVAESKSLNDANINAIVNLDGIRTWGGRTQSCETAWRFINFAEYWNYLVRSFNEGTRSVVFQPNNVNSGMLWKTVTRLLTNFLLNEKVGGAISDFDVLCGKDENPDDQVALGILRAKVEYQPVAPAEKFEIALKSSPAGLIVDAA